MGMNRNQRLRSLEAHAQAGHVAAAIGDQHAIVQRPFTSAGRLLPRGSIVSAEQLAAMPNRNRQALFSNRYLALSLEPVPAPAAASKQTTHTERSDDNAHRHRT